MAKKDKDQPETFEPAADTSYLSKLLVRELNKNSAEKIAWCLATDLDDPTTVRDFVPFGSTLLDYITCNRRGGGIPVGKLTEIVGEEASGKSLLVTHILANTQKKGGIAVLIDTENALNPQFAEQVGLDLKKLVYSQPGSIEEVFETIERTIVLAREKDVKVPITIAWDSVAGTPPKAELEGDYDPNSRIGLAAKAIAKGMRKLTQTLGKDKVTLVFTNQLKVKIGVMFGDPMTTSGGKAIPYHASLRIRLDRSVEQKDEEKNVYGIHTRAKVIKNRLGPPLRKCEFDIYFSNGIDDVGSIREYLHSCGEIEKRAGWMVMQNVPGIEGEFKFRSAEWPTIYKNTAGFREHVAALLDKHLIVSYDSKDIKDVDMDPESLMDAEAVAMG